MKIYFDSCAVQRPLDDASQVRIALEIEALLGLFALVEQGQIELVSSDVLELEISRIVAPIRRLHALNFLAQAVEFVTVTKSMEERARYYVALGLKPLDALHFVCAESIGADYFCTCDDRLLRRVKSLRGARTTVVSPLELVEELGL